jgi:hypothetical protein
MTAAALRLMRAGLVPHDRLDLLTIGRAALDREVERGLADLASGGAGEPLFVNGEWGTGKTHSLAYMRSVADRRGHATGAVVVDARARAPSHPQRLHPHLARDLRLGGRCDLRAILPALVEEPARARRIAGTVAGEFADTRDALWGLIQLVESKETARVGAFAGWRALLGTDIAGSDYAYRRDKALGRIGCIAAVLAGLGAGGLVLFFDELETIDQLWNSRSRAVAYETLGRLSGMPHVWCVFGITDRFLRTVYADARSQVYADARPAAQAFLTRFRHGEARLFAPPTIALREARRLADRVSTLYREAYGVQRPDDWDEVLATWLSGTSLNPRRLVRAVVDAHDRARALPGVRAEAA